MTAIAIGGFPTFRARYSNTGSSQASEAIQKQLDAICDSLLRANTWSPGKSLINELLEVAEECAEQNWDGYSATPVTADVYDEAQRILLALPPGLPLPEIVPEPNGSIGFEWSNGKRKTFAVSVCGEGLISYAGIFGQIEKAHGREAFNEAIPKNIIELIRRIYQ